MIYQGHTGQRTQEIRSSEYRFPAVNMTETRNPEKQDEEPVQAYIINDYLSI